MNMPDRNAHVHGDEGGIDVEPFAERALEDVVETILNFGVYPQPVRWKPGRTQPIPPTEFDLYEFLFEENDKGQMRIDPVDACEFFILAQKDHTRYGPFETARSKWEKKITEMLTDHLRDSDMVTELAAQMAEDEKYE